jgi:hypothetical protein
VATPFVGREADLAALTAELDAALAGSGGVVLVAGEPGSVGAATVAPNLVARCTYSWRGGAGTAASAGCSGRRQLFLRCQMR